MTWRLRLADALKRVAKRLEYREMTARVAARIRTIPRDQRTDRLMKDVAAEEMTRFYIERNEAK